MREADEGEGMREMDEVVALLQRVRSHLEDAVPVEPRWPTDAAHNGKGEVVEVQQQEYWLRLRYLEWSLHFLVEQQRVLGVMREATGSLRPTSARVDGVCRESEAGTCGGDGDDEDALRSCSSIIVPTPLSHGKCDDRHGHCWDGGAHLDAVLSVELTRSMLSESGETGFDREKREMVAGVTAVHEDEVVSEESTARLISSSSQQQQQQQTSDAAGAHWSCFRTWNPSKISFFMNVRQPVGSEMTPVRHVLCLCTIVHEKPRGMQAKDAALRLQGRYCKSCLCLLRKRLFPFPSWDTARFCYYTGMYYCTDCHSGKKGAVPGRVLQSWDFRPYPLCNDAVNFLELQRERPLYCLSAINPSLYNRVVSLQIARCLRLQVMALRDVGVKCHVFRQLFYREDAATPCPNAFPCLKASVTTCSDVAQDELHMKYYVTRDKRYLMEDSEMWSFADLEDMHRCHPKEAYESDSLWSLYTLHLAACSHALTITAVEADLVVFLKRLRAHMLQHILQERCTVCLRNSLDICRWCCPTQVRDMFERSRRVQDGQVEHGNTVLSSSSSSPHSVSFSENVLQSVWPGASAAAHFFTVYSFDLLHVRYCPRCGACYHKRCFYRMQREMVGCMGCLRCRSAGGDAETTRTFSLPPFGACSSNSNSSFLDECTM